MFYKYIYPLVVFIVFSPNVISAQCLQLKNNTTYSAELKPYIFDGIVNCNKIAMGQNLAYYKTLFSGILYRLKVVSSNADTKFLIEVYDLNHNLLYSNKENNYSLSWDFSPEQSLQIIVFISAVSLNAETCEVAMISGFKE